MPDPTEPTLDADRRFWSKVLVRPGCWLRQGNRTGNGYGRFWDGKRNVLAHRWAYERYVGPIPDGLQIDHLCRTPACVRPSHLEPVTAQENALRSPLTVAAVRRAASHCERGHEYTEENTYVRPNGHRACRVCAEDRRRRYRERKLQEAM